MPRLHRPLRSFRHRLPDHARPPLRSTAVAAIAGAVFVLSLVFGGVAAASTPVTVGYRDFGYGGALASRATSDPEQSKLWYNDGAWWGGLFVSSGSGSGGSHFDIFKFIPGTHSWQDTTRQIDIRDLSHGDYLWDAANSKLYVASSKSICTSVPAPPTPGCKDDVRVYRYTYDGTQPLLVNKYKLDLGFPKVLKGGLYTGGNFTGGGTNALTIAKDSGGGFWLAYTRDDPTTPAPPIVHFNSNVYLASSADGATWTTPARFGGAPDGQLDQDNTAALVAFGSNVGLYWTDKHATGASTANFAVHPNGTDPVTGWIAPETVTTGTNFIEDQVNLKADTAGKVYAVAKTGVAAQIKLFDRSTGGAWTSHTVSTSADGNTRAQVVLDEELGLAYVFSSSGSTTAGTIYVKAAPLSTLAFPAGKGTAFIKSATDMAIDDVTLTKQNVTSATGIIAEASDRNTHWFLHGEMTLAATDSTPPVGTVSINGGAPSTSTPGVTLSVPATDAGSGVSLVRVANELNTVDGSGMLITAGATSFAYAPTVTWTLAGGGDGTKTVWAQWQDSAGNWSTPISDTITLDTVGRHFHAIAPTRVLDSRINLGTGVFSSGVPRTFAVAGVSGIPSSAVAVTGNLTVTGQTSSGRVALTPDPVASPATSTINFPKGDTRANGVTVPLRSSDGTLSATYSGAGGSHTQLVFDVTGYFDTAAGSDYHGMAPARVLDSRINLGTGRFSSGVPRTFQVTGTSAGIPVGAIAVTGNLTVTAQTSAGRVALTPEPVASPSTSTINFPKGDTRANGVTIQLGSGGHLAATFSGAGGSKTQLVFDVTGWFDVANGGMAYHTITPTRVLDSRINLGTGVFASGTPGTFAVAGTGLPVPTGATAVTGNLTVTAQTSSGRVALTPDPVAMPTTSTINFPIGDTRANGVTIQLNSTGHLSATFSGAGGSHTQLVMDITGFFAP